MKIKVKDIIIVRENRGCSVKDQSTSVDDEDFEFRRAPRFPVYRQPNVRL